MKRLQRVGSALKRAVQPARTRFAPSPTGVIHLGSLRTAVYNYLLAKSTGGSFILRLEDTDQKRLVPGAEQNIYQSLDWAGIKPDEGPENGAPSSASSPSSNDGQYGPYRQSDRKDIYSKYTTQLLNEGKAYRCFCSHDRLDSLAASAREMRPPSTASYDRKCSHISREDSDLKAKTEAFVVRFKSPVRQDGSEQPDYPGFTDVLHGDLTIQPQINAASPRYDDFVISKSDGLPTYHFANVVDDHLMKITHVVRGEEWLPSTPKHVALYNSLGWTPPQFVHIPLLMGEGGKKLSKRKSALGVLEFKDTILPEAFVNFVALLGWSPANRRVGSSVNEVMDMGTLVKQFSLEGLTKGNVQVDMKKLTYFEQEHFKRALKDDFERVAELCGRGLPDQTQEQTRKYLKAVQNHVTSAEDFRTKIQDILAVPPPPKDVSEEEKTILNAVAGQISKNLPPLDLPYPKKQMFPILRKVLVAGKSGNSIQEIIDVLGPEETLSRIQKCT